MTPVIPDPVASGYTTSTPVPLYWARYGQRSNRRPVIALHGGPGADHRYLLPGLLHLAEGGEVIFYDQRGGGLSKAASNAPIGWRDHVADLASVLGEFRIHRPILIGYSWGGLLSLLYALHFRELGHPAPDRIGLISPAPVTSAYRATFDEALRKRGNAAPIALAREELAASGLKESDPAAYRQRLFELGVAGYFYDPSQASELTPFRVVGRVQQSTWESLGDFDLRPKLREVNLPSIVIHGRDDPIPAASSKDIADALRAPLVTIDHCGHVPYVEQPAALWSALDPFLDHSATASAAA